MEVTSLIRTSAEVKQSNSVSIEQSHKKVCKNRIEMPFKELIVYLK